MRNRKRILFFILKNTPIIILVSVFIIFGLFSRRFFELVNIESIARQSSYIGIAAIGMTFVLLTGGIDLSVGANMYLSASVTAILLENGVVGVEVAILLGICTGALFGLLNAFSVVQLKILPFLVTLSTLVAGRGVATLITQSRPIMLPPEITGLSSARVLGIQVPIILFVGLCIISQLFLSKTSTGKYIYAVGYNIEEAEKAGVKTNRILYLVYILSGFLAGVGGIISVSQQGNISPGFAEGIEFSAVAATVIGGTSLYGGRGGVLPGVIIGAMLIQTIQAGLVYMQVNLYIQPLASAGIIFFAVLIDSVRNVKMLNLEKKNIRMD